MTRPLRRTLLSLTVAGLSAASLAASLGCGSGNVLANLKKRAAHDLTCPAASIKTTKLGGGAWGVDGCGHTATYVLVGDRGERQWVMNSVANVAPAAAPTSAPAPQSAWVQPLLSSRNADAQVVWSAKLKLPGIDYSFVLEGTPAREPGVATLGLVGAGQPPRLPGCELKLVANGELLTLPAKEAVADPAVDRLQVKTPLATIETMAHAERVVGQVCDTRFELSKAELAVVNDFFMRFREELALGGSSAGTSGGVAVPATAQ